LYGNLAKRSTTAAASQHIDQENQCIRAGKCNNAALGEQTQGNDNSVTGFADQSKNVQQRTVTPTPTPTPTVTSTPTTGTLRILKDCSLGCPGTAFPITVTGNNPQPSSFILANIHFKDVTLGPGTFTVHESLPRGFLPPSFVGDCKQTGPLDATGTISAGQNLGCLIINFRV
jgi:hypothetical protein